MDIAADIAAHSAGDIARYAMYLFVDTLSLVTNIISKKSEIQKIVLFSSNSSYSLRAFWCNTLLFSTVWRASSLNLSRNPYQE